MAKALSVDLRRRVADAIALRSFVPKGGGTVRGKRVERDPLA